MSAGELLGIEPLELKFPFELKKWISCSLQLSNKTDSCVAFKVKTTNPKKYCVRPNTGIVLPRSTCDVIVTMQAQREAPPDMQCKDKFLFQSAKTIDGTTTKNITAEMFNKESGNVVEECKLRVVYVSPPQPPSPVTQWSEEGSPPRDSVLEDGNAARATVIEQIEGQEKSAEVLGHDYLKDLLDVIDHGNLPTFLGGNCMCSDYGGFLVSDRGLGHDREILEILKALSALDESWSFNNKIRAMKAVVKEAETKLESLESIVEDTKIVMKSLTHLIEGLNK